jgi:hypothetical protein
MVSETIEQISNLKEQLNQATAKYFDARDQMESSEKQIIAIRNALAGIEIGLKAVNLPPAS